MTPIFLAVHIAAGETGHVLLPRAEPFASTHLPDTYDGNVDLSVFNNKSHSTVRLRVYEDYVMISTLPDALHTVFVQLPTGGQISIPQSTKTEAYWIILLDGAHFTYAALRCTVEFDHDHSISNSMRPPEVPCPTDHASAFDGNDLLPDSLIPDPSPSHVPDAGEALLPKVTERLSSAGARPRISSSDKDDTSDKDNRTLKNVFNEKVLPEGSCLDLNSKTPPLRATNTSRPLQERNLNQALHNDHVPAATGYPEKPAMLSPQLCPPDPVKDQHCLEEQAQDIKDSSTEQVTKVFRRPGQESQVLHTNNSKQGVRLTRKQGEESQILHANTVEHGVQLTRQLGKESQVLHTSQGKHPVQITRKPGEESQLLSEMVQDSEKAPSESACVKKMQVKSTKFVSESLHEEPTTLKIKSVSFDVQARNPKPAKRSATAAEGVRAASTTKPKSAAALPQVQEKDSTQTRSSRRSSIESPDILASSVPMKRPASDVSERQSSPSRSQSKAPSSSSKSDEYSTDASIVSSSTRDNLKGQRKRRRSSRNETDLLHPPARPIVVFSTKCEIQKTKLTMQTFSELGGQVTDTTAKANMLCVPERDGLKKTSKLILAVIHGHIIVTETWLIHSCRKNKLLAPESYQPKDKAREKEWGVRLPAALNRGLSSDANLHELFLGCKIYLTQQLRDLLLKTNNLDGFVEIATAMGASSVKKKLPVKAGSNTVVLGVKADFDALTVDKLGLLLYDKDLLTMSALRGRREDDRDEFKIEMPVKEEPLSQT